MLKETRIFLFTFSPDYCEIDNNMMDPNLPRGEIDGTYVNNVANGMNSTYQNLPSENQRQ